MVFTGMVKSQKKEFRQQVLQHQHTTVKKIEVAAQDLYEDIKGLEWKEHNKEVVIEGVYHEVLSVERSGDHYIVSILEDRAENELFRNFFDKSDTSKGLTNYLQLVFAMNFTIPVAQEFKAQEAEEALRLGQSKHEHISDFYSKEIKPPRPRILV